MEKLKVGLYAVAAYLVLIIVFSIASPRRGASQGTETTPVFVTNKAGQEIPISAPNPIPVSSPSPLSVVGKVQAEISAPVSINPEANEVCVTDCNAQNAFNVADQVEALSGGRFDFTVLSFRVPDGKILVIETVSGSTIGIDGGNVVFRLDIENEVLYQTFPFKADFVGHRKHVATQQLKAYAGPGQVVALRTYRENRGSQTFSHMTLSGYLVDAH